MVGRVLVLIVLLVSMWQSVSAQEASEAASDFALETERRIASQQITGVRKKTGKVCSFRELPYWQQLTATYLSYGRGTEAEELWFDFLRECAQHNTYSHPDTLGVVEAIVRFYSAQNQTEKADSFLEELIKAGEQEAGHEKEKVLPLLNTCSGLYGATGNTPKQEEVLRRGLAIVTDSNRTSRLDAASWKVFLAKVLFEHQGKQEAEELYLENAPLLLEELPPYSDRAVETRQRLVQIHASRNNWTAAEPHIQILISYIREMVGEEHPTYIEWLGKLAFVYSKQEKYADALQVLKQAISLAEALGEEGQELAVSLQNFQKDIDRELDSPLVQKEAVCNEEVIQIYRLQTEEWWTILRRVSERADALKKKIEETDAFADKVEEARIGRRQAEPKPGETGKEARKRTKAHYNSRFVEYLGLLHENWGDAGLGRSCLKELAGLDRDLSRYLSKSEELYQGWDELVGICSAQGDTELTETSMNHRAFVHDGPLEESRLRQEVLAPLYTDCTKRLVNELMATSWVEASEQEFCPNLGAVVEGSALDMQELQELKKAELRLLRNGVFAKYGRSFKSDDLQTFFYGDDALPCGFYFRQDSDFTNSLLSENDRKNVSLLQSLE